MDEAKLVQVLQELWKDDNSVPGADNFRCTELDWFSQGVKDNIVKHIANEVFGEAKAEDILGST